MDLSEVKRFESKPAAAESKFEQLFKAIEHDGTFKLTLKDVVWPMSTGKSALAAWAAAWATWPENQTSKSALLKLAELLEKESLPDGSVFTQCHGVIYGGQDFIAEHSLPELAVYPSEQLLNVQTRTKARHHVCAIGKIGMLCGARPAETEGQMCQRIKDSIPGIAHEVLTQIAKLNDKGGMSFSEIAKALRGRAASAL